MSTNANTKTILQIAGLVIGIFLLCSGWVFGIVKDASAQTVDECIRKIEKIEEKKIPALEEIVRNHDKIIPVIQVELKNLNDAIQTLLRRTR